MEYGIVLYWHLKRFGDQYQASFHPIKMLEIPIDRVRVRQAIAHLVYYFTTKTKTHTSALPVSQRNPFLSLHSELLFSYWTRFVLPGCTANQNAKMPRFAAKQPSEAEKAMAPHSSTIAWRIPWTEEPGGLQSMGLRRVRHNWASSLSLFTPMHWRRKWQPTPVFLPGESQGRGSLVGCCLWGHTESDTT